MTNTTHSLRHAGTAIAAALALAATPAFAQDPAAPAPAAPAPVPVPEIVVPDIPVPVAPEPTIVLPAEDPAPAPEDTVTAPESAASPSVAPARATAPVAEVAGRAAPARELRAEASEPAPVEETGALAPVGVADPGAVEPLSPPAVEEPASATGEFDSGILALILGGLAFLALAIWGFIAIGRRKPVRRYAAAKPAPDVREPLAAEPASIDAPEPAPVAVRPARPVVEPLVAPAPASGLLPHAGASVALPRRLPDSFAGREALFRRLVDARPDRANPFTDRRARMKRARLIMQSIGREFGDAEPWIDLGQYPQNWPELARNRSAAA